ncbi:MAG: hypothetical protein ACRDST_16310 [Pseudonocardiaceae bacterium]
MPVVEFGADLVGGELTRDNLAEQLVIRTVASRSTMREPPGSY